MCAYFLKGLLYRIVSGIVTVTNVGFNVCEKWAKC